MNVLPEMSCKKKECVSVLEHPGEPAMGISEDVKVFWSVKERWDAKGLQND